MRYYVLCGKCGKCMLSLFSYEPVSLKDAQEACNAGNKFSPNLRYFIVDEERFNRWWKEYLS